MSFEVGNIIYLMHKDTHAVLPGQILEKVVRERLGRENKVTFVLEIYKSDTEEYKKITVDPEVVSMFNTIDELELCMIENATTIIKGITSQAKNDAKILLNHNNDDEDKKAMTREEVQDKPETYRVTLENGQEANVRVHRP